MDAADQQKRPAQARRSFSARARRAAVLAAQGHSRKEIAAIIGVAPETVSVWKRHPRWQAESERWRALAEAPLERMQARLQLESLEAESEALEAAPADGERDEAGANKQRRSGSAGLADAAEGLPARAGRLRPAVSALHAQAGEAAPSVPTLRLLP